MKSADPIKVFVAEASVRALDRRQLNNIMQLFVADLCDSEAVLRYGICGNVFERTESPTDAAFHLLPYLWRYYVDGGKIAEAATAYRRALEAGKRLVVFSAGDPHATVPFPEAVLFELGPYYSRRYRPLTFALPVFRDDRAQVLYGGDPPYRQKQDRPVVGFCGQGGAGMGRMIARTVFSAGRRITHGLGLRRWEPPPFEHTRLRQQVLDTFAASSAVDSNFVVRKQYRAGVKERERRDDPYDPTNLEFTNNITNSDYTLCVRGGGNFSVRFYETLCLGRIPILVNTDCLLPFDFSIDWERYCVIVESTDLIHAPEQVADFHASLSPSDFVDLQRACRRLWLSRFTSDGFWGHFHEFIPYCEARSECEQQIGCRT